MIHDYTVSLIIPCKNEAETLKTFLPSLPPFIDQVVVVDNNSSDDTYEVAKSLGADVVKEPRKDSRGIGYGYAHMSGMKKAKGDYIVTMDGDGTYPMGAIWGLIRFMISNELDFVTCSRFPLLNKEAISRLRQVGVWALNTEVQLLYGYPMKDILSGMWAMNQKTVDKLELKEGGWDLSPEVKLDALIRQDVSFAQYHIDHHPRDNGASHQKLFETGFNHLKYIFKRRMTVDNPIKLMLNQGNFKQKAMKL